MLCVAARPKALAAIHRGTLEATTPVICSRTAKSGSSSGRGCQCDHGRHGGGHRERHSSSRESKGYKHLPCFDLQKGKCTCGDSCRYAHTAAVPSAAVTSAALPAGSEEPAPILCFSPEERSADSKCDWRRHHNVRAHNLCSPSSQSGSSVPSGRVMYAAVAAALGPGPAHAKPISQGKHVPRWPIHIAETSPARNRRTRYADVAPAVPTAVVALPAHAHVHFPFWRSKQGRCL